MRKKDKIEWGRWQEAGQREGRGQGGGEDESIKAGKPEVGTVFVETHIRLLHRCNLLIISNLPTPTFNKQSSQLLQIINIRLVG